MLVWIYTTRHRSIHSRKHLYEFIQRISLLVNTYINLYKELVSLVRTCIDLFFGVNTYINLYKELVSRENLYRFIHRNKELVFRGECLYEFIQRDADLSIRVNTYMNLYNELVSRENLYKFIHWDKELVFRVNTYINLYN